MIASASSPAAPSPAGRPLTEHPLPESLRAVFDADPHAAVRLVDAASGRAWRLAPEPTAPEPTAAEPTPVEPTPVEPTPAPRPTHPPDATEAELDEADRIEAGLDHRAAYRGRGSDADAIRRGLAQAEAGELLTLDEVRAKAEARLPFLKNRRSSKNR